MKKAFTLVEVLITVAILGLFMSIVIPNLIKAKNRSNYHTAQVEKIYPDGNGIMFTTTYENHKWIVLKEYSGGFQYGKNTSMFHHPDCECFKGEVR